MPAFYIFFSIYQYDHPGENIIIDYQKLQSNSIMIHTPSKLFSKIKFNPAYHFFNRALIQTNSSLKIIFLVPIAVHQAIHPPALKLLPWSNEWSFLGSVWLLREWLVEIDFFPVLLSFSRFSVNFHFRLCLPDERNVEATTLFHELLQFRILKLSRSRAVSVYSLDLRAVHLARKNVGSPILQYGTTRMGTRVG